MSPRWAHRLDESAPLGLASVSLLCWAPVSAGVVVAYVALLGSGLVLVSLSHQPRGCVWCPHTGARRAAVPAGWRRPVRWARQQVVPTDGVVVAVLVVCAALGVLLGPQAGMNCLGAGYALALWACR